jgi:hypothetical protein
MGPEIDGESSESILGAGQDWIRWSREVWKVQRRAREKARRFELKVQVEIAEHLAEKATKFGASAAQEAQLC